MSKSVYVVIRLELDTDSENSSLLEELAQEVTSSMDYKCKHKKIVETEVIGTYTEEPL